MGSPGDWRFKPDDGAMVTLPDQDWIAFGFWMTSPDDAVNGDPRLGVTYQGMEEYGYPTEARVAMFDSTDTAGNRNGLRGTATYDGAAAGYYVDGMDDGMFTARASLTAAFKDDDASTTDDHVLSGRIDNFRRSDGSYLGSDTPSNPNDPNRGGEGDWYVNLGATMIDPMGVIKDTYSAGGTAQQLVPFNNAGGSADGVNWDGEWEAQLYGRGHRDSGKKSPPSGIAGAFRVTSGKLEGGGYRGVVGSFGAQLTEATGP